MAGVKSVTVSTGKAARICGVKPDTVLKWIKGDKIKATRTAGGHFRIERGSLRPFVGSDRELLDKADQPIGGVSAGTLRCWEFCGGGADKRVREQCLECIVFKSNATNCYVLSALGKQGGHAGVYCVKTCDECAYYRYVQNEHAKVLVITDDSDLTERLSSVASDTVDMRFATCGYTASRTVGDFVPDIILVDEELKGTDAKELCTHLLDDDRLAGCRIYLATAEVLRTAGTEKCGRPARQKSRRIKTASEYLKVKS